MVELTGRQGAMLASIRAYLARHGYAPSLREIGNDLGIRSTNGVFEHLQRLIAKGYIERDSMRSRAIRLTRKGESWGEETPVPNAPSRTVKCPFCKVNIVVPEWSGHEKVQGTDL